MSHRLFRVRGISSLGVITLLFLALAIGSSVPTQAQGDPQKIEESIRSGVLTFRRGMNTGLQLQLAAEIGVTIMRQDAEWAWAVTGLEIPAGVHAAPDSYLVIVRLVNEEWVSAVEGTQTFQQWLLLAPDAVISPLEKNIHKISLTTQGDGSAQLSLPYATGETWAMTGGPHTNDGAQTGIWSAIDMNGGSRQVRAARDGVAYRPCNNGIAFVRVDHADGWQTGYYHLASIQVFNMQGVSRGQYLGNTSTVVDPIICKGSASGPHVHFSLRRNRTGVAWNGKDVGGWTIQQGSSQYTGVMVRVRDGFETTSSVLNEGTIGSGAPPENPLVPTWMNLIKNPEFNDGLNHWLKNSFMNWAVQDGVLLFNSQSGGTGQIYQDFGYRVQPGMRFQIAFDVGNIGGDASKYVRAYLRGSPNADWSNAIVCQFTTPNTSGSMKRVIIEGMTTANWPNFGFMIETLPLNAVPNQKLDNLNVYFIPNSTVSNHCDETTSIPPRVNITRNNTFSGGTGEWAILNDMIANTGGGGVAIGLRADRNWGELIQGMSHRFDIGDVIEMTADITNTTNVPRNMYFYARHDRVTPNGWPICFFTVPPGRTGKYVMRAKAQVEAPRINIGIGVNGPSDGVAGLRVTNVTMRRALPWSMPNTTICMEAVKPDTIGVSNLDNAAWLLRYTNTTGAPNTSFVYGQNLYGALPLEGDWDGNGVDTQGIYVRYPAQNIGVFALTNTFNNFNAAQLPAFVFGDASNAWIPVSGDWDGNGFDSIGLYNTATGVWVLNNDNASSAPEYSFTYGGGAGLYPVVGDWNGDGVDTVGLYQFSTGKWLLINANQSLQTEMVIDYGAAGYSPVVGDWDGDGIDSIGLYNKITGHWSLHQIEWTHLPPISLNYGQYPSLVGLSGKWNSGASSAPVRETAATAAPSQSPPQPQVAPTFAP